MGAPAATSAVAPLVKKHPESHVHQEVRHFSELSRVQPPVPDEIHKGNTQTISSHAESGRAGGGTFQAASTRRLKRKEMYSEAEIKEGYPIPVTSNKDARVMMKWMKNNDLENGDWLQDVIWSLDDSMDEEEIVGEAEAVQDPMEIDSELFSQRRSRRCVRCNVVRALGEDQLHGEDFVCHSIGKDCVHSTPLVQRRAPRSCPLLIDLNDSKIAYDPYLLMISSKMKVTVPREAIRTDPRQEALAAAAAKAAENPNPDENITEQLMANIPPVYFNPRRDPVVLATKKANKDPFNVSMDDLYSKISKVRPVNKRRRANQHSGVHATPALKLATFRTHYTTEDLREFRRPKLIASKNTRYRVQLDMPLHTTEQTRKGKDPADMDITDPEHEWGAKKDDFSAATGDVVLAEYVLEENPVLLSGPGMSSFIVNYCRKQNVKDTCTQLSTFAYGTGKKLELKEDPPFLGVVYKKPVRMIENSLFNAPVHEHEAPKNTFLLIRNRHDPKQFKIRAMPQIFAVGQEQLIKEISPPNSRTTTTFVKNRLQAHIYRMFGKKKNEGHVRHKDICDDFPAHSDTAIRKRLKDCGSFHRFDDGMHWVLKPSVRLPSEEELRHMITPEQVCLYEAMLVGLQRLQDEGVHRFTISANLQQLMQTMDEDKHKEEAKIIDDLLNLTPWNLSANFLQNQAGKGSMKLAIEFSEGVAAENLGNELLFSYVKRKPIPKEVKKPKILQAKASVTGTGADLRKVSHEDAALLLMKFDQPEQEIRKMKRWDRINKIRELSSKVAASGNESQLTKYARSPRYFQKQYDEQYVKEIKDKFERQMKFIAVEADDDDVSSGDEGEDVGVDLENYLLKEKGNKEQESFESVTADNLKEQMRQQIEEEKKNLDTADANGDAYDEELVKGSRPGRKKVIKRVRDVVDGEGVKHSYVDYIRDPKLVAAYLTNKTLPPPTVTPLGIIGLGNSNARRGRRGGRVSKKTPKPRRRRKKKKKGGETGGNEEDDYYVKYSCSACGEEGHTRNNRLCPLYGKTLEEKERAAENRRRGIIEKKRKNLSGGKSEGQSSGKKRKRSQNDSGNEFDEDSQMDDMNSDGDYRHGSRGGETTTESRKSSRPRSKSSKKIIKLLLDTNDDGEVKESKKKKKKKIKSASDMFTSDTDDNVLIYSTPSPKKKKKSSSSSSTSGVLGDHTEMTLEEKKKVLTDMKLKLRPIMRTLLDDRSYVLFRFVIFSRLFQSLIVGIQK